MERDKFIFLSLQKDPQTQDAGKDDIYREGTIARILQMVQLPNDALKILIDGSAVGKISRFKGNDGSFMEAEVEILSDKLSKRSKETQALVRQLSDLYREFIELSDSTPPDTLVTFDSISDPIRKLYFAASNVTDQSSKKQEIISTPNVKEQFLQVISLIKSEIEMLKIEEDLDLKVHEAINKSQRRFFIQEQIRALQQELGDDEDALPEVLKLRHAIDEARMPESALAAANEELDKLRRMNPMAPEFSVVRNYLDWMVSLPWSKEGVDNLDVTHARSILERDHYALQKVKERILEYIAVLNLTGKVQGQVLCFSGPPGVGKTSLARSIAESLGRPFLRISLGGVRDEAEIRGHRRTYLGSMPGKIIQAMKKAGVTNPVILLDEIDKMSMDFRGDPSSALLEVLDPEQNASFNDHYLEVDYNLSKVLFIATANVKYDIPAPLLDRMEVIEVGSYLEHEKVEIARRHLVPKQLKANGLEHEPIKFSDEALQLLIAGYTKEAGVRNLERYIASTLRKIAKEMVEQRAQEAADGKPKRRGRKKAVTLKRSDIIRLLKTPPFFNRNREKDNRIGVANGLAWTSVGGDTMPVEVTIMPGKDKLTLTGKLGDVMKESAMAALSFVRSNATRLSVSSDFADGKDIHIHVPEGAIPKDGPSAGITMTMALVSAATGKKLRADVAMTGEITLRGHVLAIGGLSEKLLAAKNAGMTTVIIPKENEAIVEDIDKAITDDLTIVPVATVMEAIPFAFA